MIGWLMNKEQLVEWQLEEETKVLEENLTYCHHGQHKSHMTNHFSYDKAS
jgi:hypothetical protein